LPEEVGAATLGEERANTMNCRAGCGACCIAPSISSPIPGMPLGKAAGVRCLQLSPDNLCRLFGRPDRPAVCVGLRPSEEMCGRSFAEALDYLARLEARTAPPRSRGGS
jgi:Fe-S-cluster containining protein